MKTKKNASLLCKIAAALAACALAAFAVAGCSAANNNANTVTENNVSNTAVNINDNPNALAPGTSMLTAKQVVQIQNRIIALINKDRMAKLKPAKGKKKSSLKLKTAPKLKMSAAIRSSELRTYWSHTRPNGTSWKTALKKVGVRVGKVTIGENLANSTFAMQDAYSTADVNSYAQQIHDDLMASPTHKANILKKKYAYIGVSVYQCMEYGQLSLYVCEHFCNKKG